MSLSTDYSTSKSHTNLSSLEFKNINLEHLDSEARAVLDFWFDKDNEPYWFAQNDDFDKKINDRFGKPQNKANASRGALQTRQPIVTAQSQRWRDAWLKSLS